METYTNNEHIFMSHTLHTYVGISMHKYYVELLGIIITYMYIYVYATCIFVCVFKNLETLKEKSIPFLFSRRPCQVYCAYTNVFPSLRLELLSE